MYKIYLFFSELVFLKNSFSSLRIFFLKSAGINFSSDNVFIDKGFECHNPSNIFIGKNVSIGHFARLWAFNKIIIGDNVQIALGFTIVSGSHDKQSFAPLMGESMEVVLEGECWIGANVLILAGVKVGKGVIIGAGSIVNKDLPPYTICVGNPCRPISKRIPSEYIENPFGKYSPTSHA